MLQTSAVTCAVEFLGQTLDLFSGCDFVVSVYDRFETSRSGNPATANSTSGIFQVSDHVSFSNDGLLMSADKTVGVLLKHVLRELLRRGFELQELKTGPKGSSKAGAVEGSVDLEEFVMALQKSENHILAIRSLLSSWSSFNNKAKVYNYISLALAKYKS